MDKNTENSYLKLTYIEINHIELNLNDDLNTNGNQNTNDDEYFILINSKKYTYWFIFWVVCISVIFISWLSGLITFGLLLKYYPENIVYRVMLHVFFWPAFIFIMCYLRHYFCG